MYARYDCYTSLLLCCVMESVSSGAEVGSHHEGDPIIAKLEASSIDRVVAGQAVTDLASAVKELVDNALDANSKTIKSKWKSFVKLSCRCLYSKWLSLDTLLTHSLPSLLCSIFGLSHA